MFLSGKRLISIRYISVLVILNLGFLLVYNVLNEKPVNTQLKRDWHDYEAIEAALGRKGLAEVGQPISLDKYKNALYAEYGYDALLSDQISVNRSVPDIRPKNCKKRKYLAQLPKAAIIIIFFNERLSVLLRTVHSIINRTPKELLQEIILVDDRSTYPELHDLLTDYLRLNLPEVRLVRIPKRLGLMGARNTGARAASKESKVLIFMDAHIEVNYNWLPPLIEPIVLNPKACTSPRIDRIAFKNFQYKVDIPYKGYFTWKLKYYFQRIKHVKGLESADNTHDYILMGAAIAIGAEFFWELGGFDDGMIFWGGEQFELSFKVWMCGGEILVVPCSRMAHLYRDPHTKSNSNLYGKYSFLTRNIRRLVDVWMDEEHRQYAYNHNPRLKVVDPGDLTDRFKIRNRLHCRSFSWMMENVMPGIKKLHPPIAPADLASGLLRSYLDPTLCIALPKVEAVLKPCPAKVSSEDKMYWTYNFRGEIRTNSSMCLETNLSKHRVNGWSCHFIEGNQKWYYDREHQWIVHVENRLCMLADIKILVVQLAKCDPSKLSMKWTLTNIYPLEMDKWESKLGWNFKFHN